MSKESIESKLDSVFSNVNDWLKFAEQKNAALLALNGGVVWGMTRILPKSNELELIPYWLALLGYIIIVCSALICIISFLPVLKEKWFKPEKKNSSDNCLYFADIAKYNKREYIEFLTRKVELDNYSATRYELDLSSQVVTNAEIALDKYKKFKLASKLTIFSVFVFSTSIGFYHF